MDKWLAVDALEGPHARLEALREDHAGELLAAGGDAATWTWLPRGPLASHEDAKALVRDALAGRDIGSEWPFVIRRLPDGVVVGSTRYLAIRAAHRGVEIGWTWLNPSAWRTAINTQCKLLLLSHAFDRGAERVELKTDALNVRSRAAIRRLGATEEGILRHHMQRPDGSWRDSVYHSILRDEWPAARERLEARLGADG
jgi:RimJ/RimL family protein N-acetyltransferase